MSHATYAFLFSATEDVLDSRSVADVEYLFEDLYANDFCDENNWYQPEVVVFRDGSFLPMAPKDDHRGRDFFQDEIDRMPQDQRWAFAKRFGLDTIVHDFGILGFSPFGLIPNTGQRAIEDYSDEELYAAIWRDVPDSIADVMYSLSGVVPTERFNYDLYNAMKNLSRFDALCDAFTAGVAPFCTPSTPYDGRRSMRLSYNLSDVDQDDAAILFVDIHT